MWVLTWPGVGVGGVWSGCWVLDGICNFYRIYPPSGGSLGSSWAQGPCSCLLPDIAAPAAYLFQAGSEAERDGPGPTDKKKKKKKGGAAAAAEPPISRKVKKMLLSASPLSPIH